MKDDVLEELHRLAERIARVPQYDVSQYDFWQFEPQWGSPFKPWEEEPEKRVRLFATNSADGKPVRGNLSNLIL